MVKNILVTGDIAIDCHFIRHAQTGSDPLKWSDLSRAEYCERWGGAALLSRLIEESFKNRANLKVSHVKLPAQIPANEKRYLRCYTAWEPQKKEDEKKDAPMVWRVKEFLGIQPSGNFKPQHESDLAPDIIVIDDSNLSADISSHGFCRNTKLWPECLKKVNKSSWVVWKMWRRNFNEDLGLHLLDTPARLVLILTANGLREDGDFISKGVSWERTAQELYFAVAEKFTSRIEKHVTDVKIIISLGTSGAFIFSAGANVIPPRGMLVFDPQNMEDEWTSKRSGRMIGQTACLTTGVVLAIADNIENPEWVKGVKAGLSSMRSLYDTGYEYHNNACQDFDFPYTSIAEGMAKILAASISGQTSPFSEKEFTTTVVPDPKEELTVAMNRGKEQCNTLERRWSILKSKYGVDIYECSREITRRGIGKGLVGVPVMTCGGLTTVDRQEIENFRNIRNLLMEYAQSIKSQKGESKPVSVAVFGPPGSGKSFGVKQIAKGMPGNVKEMTFNLSQFTDPSKLIAAFHLVRDSRLGGNLPLVFWDEFDTTLSEKTLGWLRYFLEPMQDGTFLDGQLTHPIGPAIFVFAGGTRSCFNDFSIKPDQVGYDAFKSAKGPDFISRLRGYLDIMGPNPKGDDATADPTFVIRRAILLNSLLSRLRPGLLNAKKELNIDDGVLRAFLTISRYRHGARSMESIVMSSALTGEKRFEAFCLPQKDQLDLHVPAWEFLALVHGLSDEKIEKMAEEFHNNYVNSLKARGYKLGKQSNDAKKISSQLVSWEQLSSAYKDANRKAARALADKIAQIGYVMAPILSDDKSPISPELIEKLAEIEHERWLREKITAGWRQATAQKGKKKYIRNDTLKIHDAMLPWKAMTIEERAIAFPEHPDAVGLEKLSESQKEKDRDQVRAAIAVLEKLRYRLVPTELREQKGTEPVPACQWQS